MKAKRHKWASGMEQRCLNANCPWLRRNVSDGRGGALSVFEYKRADEDIRKWREPYKVPRCEGDAP